MTATPQIPALKGMSPLGISPIKEVPTIAVFPEDQLTLSQKVEKWVWQLCRALEANYDRRYPNSSDPVRFSMESGRKYWKIMQNQGGVHAFIDKKTGEVYKPASWRGPAKIVRYDLRVIREREECLSRADWAGGYLYVR